MRLADMKWGESLGVPFAQVTDGKKLYRIRKWKTHGTVIYCGVDDILRGISELELACWLADKEPADAPQHHLDK